MDSVAFRAECRHLLKSLVAGETSIDEALEDIASAMSQAVSAELADVVEHRAVIEQAKGMLMEQSGVGPDDAFKLLVRASQRENRKLRDIAADVVGRHQLD